MQKNLLQISFVYLAKIKRMKSKISALAIAALSLAGATQAATPQQQTETKQVQKVNQIRQTKDVKFDGFGGIQHTPYFAGTPPKMYGQWLQRAGRQKWNKKK